MTHNNIPPGVIYTSSNPEFVGRIPVRTELTILESDAVYHLRQSLYNLLSVLLDSDIESIYQECLNEATVAVVIES